MLIISGIGRLLCAAIELSRRGNTVEDLHQPACSPGSLYDSVRDCARRKPSGSLRISSRNTSSRVGWPSAASAASACGADILSPRGAGPIWLTSQYFKANWGAASKAMEDGRSGKAFRDGYRARLRQ